jgi:hypothetical protein
MPLWKTEARRIVAWRRPLDEERARMGAQVLVSLDCQHDMWVHSSAIYWRGQARFKLHCPRCEELTRSQLLLFKPTRWLT